MTKYIISALALPLVLTLSACNDSSGASTPAPAAPNSKTTLPGVTSDTGSTGTCKGKTSAAAKDAKGKAVDCEKGKPAPSPTPSPSCAPTQKPTPVTQAPKPGAGQSVGQAPSQTPGQAVAPHPTAAPAPIAGKDMAINGLRDKYFTVQIADAAVVERLALNFETLRIVKGQVKAEADLSAEDHGAVVCGIKETQRMAAAVGASYRMDVDSHSVFVDNGHARVVVTSVEGFQIDCTKADSADVMISDLDAAFSGVLSVSFSE